MPRAVSFFLSMMCFSSIVSGLPLEVTQARIFETIKGVKVSAAFMNIYNPADKAEIIIKIESSDFDAVEIHESVEQKGRMKMFKRDRITVEPKRRFELKPRGWHLMLINPRVHLTAGKKVSFTMTNSLGQTKTFSASVVERDVPKVSRSGKKSYDSNDHGSHSRGSHSR